MRPANHSCQFALPALLALLLAACGGTKDDADEAAAATALVALAPLIPHTVHAIVTAVGTVELAPDAAQEIALPYEASVRRVLVTRGAHVVRGQPLIELVASAGTHAAPDQARRDANLAAAEHARLLRLHQQGLATNNELHAAANADANAQEQLAAIATDTALSRTQTIHAPIAGVIDIAPAQAGAIIAAGVTLARIATSDHLLARIGFEPDDAEHLDTVVGRTLSITSLRNPTHHVTAQLTALDRRIDADSRLIRAVATLPADSSLLPGETVRAELATATHKNVPCVPRTAVQYEGNTPYVYVVITEHNKAIARRREIRIGLSDDDFIEVRAGLPEHASVVTTGSYELTDGVAVRTAAAPHQ